MVFTSGIVDEGSRFGVPVLLSTARPVPLGGSGGCGTWGWGSGRGGLAHCWALRDQPVGWLARSLLSLVARCVRVVVGGFVV